MNRKHTSAILTAALSLLSMLAFAQCLTTSYIEIEPFYHPNIQTQEQEKGQRMGLGEVSPTAFEQAACVQECKEESDQLSFDL